VICANHYLTPELREEPLNLEFLRAETSGSRYERMEELLAAAQRPLDAPAAAALLRDRSLPGGRFAGNGHRGTLNPLIATHAVIMDLTDGRFWASLPPHQLGQFVAFDVGNFERELPELTLPADPMLASGEYDRHLAAKASLAEGWQELERGRAQQALACAERAEQSNPGFYPASWLAGESLARLGRRPEARAALQRALAGDPALGAERRRIQESLRDLEP
jgi:tetratricopeptide (TPR) repeat protein